MPDGYYKYFKFKTTHPFGFKEIIITKRQIAGYKQNFNVFSTVLREDGGIITCSCSKAIGIFWSFKFTSFKLSCFSLKSSYNGNLFVFRL